MSASEVCLCDIKTGIDNRAADAARARKLPHQCVTVVPTNSPLEGGERGKGGNIIQGCIDVQSRKRRGRGGRQAYATVERGRAAC